MFIEILLVKNLLYDSLDIIRTSHRVIMNSRNTLTQQFFTLLYTPLGTDSID